MAAAAALTLALAAMAAPVRGALAKHQSSSDARTSPTCPCLKRTSTWSTQQSQPGAAAAKGAAFAHCRLHNTCTAQCPCHPDWWSRHATARTCNGSTSLQGSCWEKDVERMQNGTTCRLTIHAHLRCLAGLTRMWSGTASCGRSMWRAPACPSLLPASRRPPSQARSTVAFLPGPSPSQAAKRLELACTATDMRLAYLPKQHQLFYEAEQAEVTRRTAHSLPAMAGNGAQA